MSDRNRTFSGWFSNQSEPTEPGQLETSGPTPLDAPRDIEEELALIEDQRQRILAEERQRREDQAEVIADFRWPRLNDDDGPIGFRNNGWARW